MAYHLTALPHPASPGAEDAVFSSPTLLSLISSCIHNLSGLGLDSVACTFLYPTFLPFTLTLVLRCAGNTVSCPNAILPPIAVSGATRVMPDGGVVSEPNSMPRAQLLAAKALPGPSHLPQDLPITKSRKMEPATKGIKSQGSHEVPAPASPDGHVCNRQHPVLIFSQSCRYPQVVLLQGVCIGIAAAAAAALEALADPEPSMCSLPLISSGAMARYVCRLEHIGASGQRLASGLLRRTDGGGKRGTFTQCPTLLHAVVPVHIIASRKSRKASVNLKSFAESICSSAIEHKSALT
ncbi:hypothetical protein I7I51_02564 [Histoplasma capsulatum]|uniref:Uncharacterized protein n=1 Tax=Ajellomyces capsulatus TaxID=5037 RepID=A0A8A1MA20_AJECA|nr:hypothetical protein I7I51_02564 [Histoplasma capsulatum]